MFGQGYNAYLFDHYFHRTGLTMLPTVFQYLPVAVVMLFATRLGNKLGRREVCSYGVLLAAVEIMNRRHQKEIDALTARIEALEAR